MTANEQLELAAKGLKLPIDFSKWLDCGSHLEYLNTETGKYWNPAYDQADSDLMACQLGIDIKFANKVVYAGHPAAPSWWAVMHDDTLGGKCAAVREARLVVAAEIGRSMR